MPVEANAERSLAGDVASDTRFESRITRHVGSEQVSDLTREIDPW